MMGTLWRTCGLLVAALLWVAASAGESAASKPNVLFIAVDDLRPELGCYGTRAKTPNIDRFAASGLQFDRAYCNQAVCGASRVSLMTGLYPEFTGERTYHVTDWRKRWAKIITLNQHFKAGGYTTIGLGKIYHGSGGPGVDPDNWTRWIKVNGKQYGDPASLKGGNLRDRKGRKRGPSTESADVPDDTHVDGNRAAVGAAQISRLAREEKPFFLAVGFTKPHLPFVAPKKYWDLYTRDSFAMPGNVATLRSASCARAVSSIASIISDWPWLRPFAIFGSSLAMTDESSTPVRRKRNTELSAVRDTTRPEKMGEWSAMTDVSFTRTSLAMSRKLSGRVLPCSFVLTLFPVNPDARSRK